METDETELKYLYLGFDLIVLNITIIILYSLKIFITGLNIPDKSFFLLLLNMSYVITYSVFSVRNLYLHDDFSNRIKRITNRILIFLIISFIFAHLFLPINFSHIFLLSCAASFYAAELFFYYFLYNYLKYRRSKGYFIHRVLIIGLNDMSIFLRHLLNNNPTLGYKFVGYVSESQNEDKDVLGRVDELDHLVSDNQIDFLFVTHSAFNDIKRSKELLATCNKIGVRLRFIPENQYWFKTSMNLESVGSLTVFNPQEILRLCRRTPEV